MNFLEVESFRPNRVNRDPIPVPADFRVIDVSNDVVKMPIWDNCRNCGDVYKFGSYNKDPKNKCNDCKWNRIHKRGCLQQQLDNVDNYPDFFEDISVDDIEKTKVYLTNKINNINSLLMC